MPRDPILASDLPARMIEPVHATDRAWGVVNVEPDTKAYGGRTRYCALSKADAASVDSADKAARTFG